LRTALAAGKYRAADALREMGEKAAGAVDALSGALSHSDARVRVSSARALGAIGPKAAAAAPALAKALKDQDFNVRHAAAAALGKLGEAAGSQAAALAAAAGDKRQEVSRSAILSLGQCGKSGIAELTKLLSDSKDAFVRKYAARALGDAKGGVDVLAKALSDKDPEVRREAVWSLGLIGSEAKSASAALKKAASEDADYAVRYAAPEALKRIGG
jgi:HEAT repeat protein